MPVPTKRPVVTIDWPSMFYVCMDVHCVCGESFHNDVYDKMKQPTQYMQCPHCQRVLRMDSQTELSVAQIDFNRERGHHAFVQWKGTELHGTAHCGCGNDIAIHRDFAYHVTCGQCHQHYFVDPDVTIFEAGADEVAALPEGTVRVCEADHDDWDDETHAAEQTAATERIMSLFPEGTPDGEGRIIIFPDVHIGDPAGMRAAIAAMTKAMQQGGRIISVGDIADQFPYRPGK